MELGVAGFEVCFRGWFWVTSDTLHWSRLALREIMCPGLPIRKVFRIGEQPMNFNMQAFYSVMKPDGGPD